MPLDIITNNSSGGTLSGVIDARITENQATTNFGSETSLYVQGGSGIRIDTLILFPLPTGFAGRTVNAVTFSVRGDSGNSSGGAGSVTYRVQRLLPVFVENEATWNIRSAGNSWATAGALGAADRDSTVLGSATWSAAAYQDFSAAAFVTAVQAAATAGATHFGVVLSETTQATTGQYLAFFSSSGADGSRPKLLIDSTAGGSDGTASGVTLTAAASLIPGSASGVRNATASGATITATASFTAGSASGVVAGTLALSAAGNEFIARTGSAISTFAREVGVAYKVEVYADGLTMGSPIYTSGSLTTDSSGRLPNVSSALLTVGATVKVVPTRQSDGVSGFPRRMVIS